MKHSTQESLIKRRTKRENALLLEVGGFVNKAHRDHHHLFQIGNYNAHRVNQDEWWHYVFSCSCIPLWMHYANTIMHTWSKLHASRNRRGVRILRKLSHSSQEYLIGARPDVQYCLKWKWIFLSKTRPYFPGNFCTLVKSSPISSNNPWSQFLRKTQAESIETESMKDCKFWNNSYMKFFFVAVTSISIYFFRKNYDENSNSNSSGGASVRMDLL